MGKQIENGRIGRCAIVDFEMFVLSSILFVASLAASGQGYRILEGSSFTISHVKDSNSATIASFSYNASAIIQNGNLTITTKANNTNDFISLKNDKGLFNTTGLVMVQMELTQSSNISATCRLFNSSGLVTDYSSTDDFDIDTTIRTINFTESSKSSMTILITRLEITFSYENITTALTTSSITTGPPPPTPPSIPVTTAVVSPPYNPNNFLINGDFEDPQQYNRPSNAWYTVSTGSRQLTGWSVIKGSIDVYLSWTCNSGNKALDMSGDRPGTISQAVSLTPGSYLLSFWLAGNPHVSSTVNPIKQLQLRISDAANRTIESQVYKFNATGKNETNMGWKYNEVSFAITAYQNYTVAFSVYGINDSATGNQVNVGPALDNVTLLLIPAKITNASTVVDDGGKKKLTITEITIIAAVCAGVVLIAIIVIVVLILVRRRRLQREIELILLSRNSIVEHSDDTPTSPPVKAVVIPKSQEPPPEVDTTYRPVDLGKNNSMRNEGSVKNAPAPPPKPEESTYRPVDLGKNNNLNRRSVDIPAKPKPVDIPLNRRSVEIPPSPPPKPALEDSSYRAVDVKKNSNSLRSEGGSTNASDSYSKIAPTPPPKPGFEDSTYRPVDVKKNSNSMRNEGSASLLPDQIKKSLPSLPLPLSLPPPEPIKENLRPKSNYVAPVKKLMSWEIDYSEIQLEEQIGKGAFGAVYKGKWRNQAVAVKKVLGDFNETEVAEFMKEADVQCTLRPHENVVQFFGVVSSPPCILVKFYANGSLLNYLQVLNSDVPEGLLVSILKGIAAGMAHLHQEKVIHRDLAARNVLLTERLEAVVSDFGFARVVQSANDASTTKANIGPIKWMSPESLTMKVYSERTDVWSFAITALEVITRKPPYDPMDSVDVIMAVTSGHRMTIPAINPRLKTLIENCWQTDPNLRPTFQIIYEELGNIQSELK